MTLTMGTDGLTSVDRMEQLMARDLEGDHEHGVKLARAIIGRAGSRWHDVDQRLARAVLRLENGLR